MTRDILIIPLSTIAPDLMFSIEGSVFDKYRSSMKRKPDIVEILV